MSTSGLVSRLKTKVSLTWERLGGRQQRRWPAAADQLLCPPATTLAGMQIMASL